MSGSGEPSGLGDKRELQREQFSAVDPVYWRPRGAPAYRRLTADDLAALRERFRRAGNLGRLDG